MSPDEFEDVQAEPDALRQARRATELMAIYQQRGTELARLRREAIERATLETGHDIQCSGQGTWPVQGPDQPDSGSPRRRLSEHCSASARSRSPCPCGNRQDETLV